MHPTVDFIIRQVGILHLPIITVTQELTGYNAELYRGEFYKTPEEALARMKHIWDTNGTADIKQFREDLPAA